MAFQWPRSASVRSHRPSPSQSSQSSASARGGGANVKRRKLHTASRSSRNRSASTSSSRLQSTPAPQQPRVQYANSARSGSVVDFALSQSQTPSAHGPAFDSLSTIREDYEQDLDMTNEIVMAVDMNARGTVGCSYYVAAEEKLYFMEDVTFGGVEVVDNLKLFINPTIVLISTRVEEQIITLLDPETRPGTADASEPLNRPYLLEQRPAADFAYEAAKSKLVSLRIGASDGPQVSYSVPGDVDARDDYNEHDPNVGRQASLLRLSSWIMIDSQLTVGCAGSILSYLQRRRAAHFLPGDEDAQDMFRISVIEMFTLRGTMFINSDTLLSLQVMQSESHPHLHNLGPTKGTSGSKEGLSVYGLFHHLARTPQGKYMLKQYFLRPSLSLDLINERHDAISVLLQTANESAFQTLAQNLKKIVNVRKIMINLRKGISASSGKSRGVSRSIWKSLHLFVYHGLALSRVLEELIGAEMLAIYAKMKAHIDIQSLARVGQMISDIVDFERSDEEGRTVVRVGVSDELDEQRHLYDGIDSLLSHTAREIATSIPEGLPLDLNVVYLPQIGFLITMPMDPETGRSMWEGTEEEDVWEKMFSSETNVYYKNRNMHEMDHNLGDVWNDICDKEIEIIHELVQRILEHEKALSAASDVCGELDCRGLSALAQGAALYRLSRPHMVDDNIINIKGGRHPLQERTVPSYVPNDCLIVGGEATTNDQHERPNPSVPRSDSHQIPSVLPDGPSLLMMTGPNYSGKSVYLKQIALIVYMAQIGSFVPADSARIGLTDKILTRISTQESVSRDQSAFMIDLQQICMALTHSTPRSLLIIDEFGKGTNAEDGAGLAAGVFEYLLNLGPQCPKVLAATHYHEIFEAGFLAPRARLGFAHMEIRVDEEYSMAEEQITYLYNYRAGRSVASYGTFCAAMNGIGPEIVRRAEELVLLTVRGEDLVTACAMMPGHEMVELREAEEVAREFLARDVVGDPRTLLDEIVSASTATGTCYEPSDRSVVSAYTILS